MDKMIRAREAALQWGLTERQITGMCRNGKIPGAVKQVGLWYLPANATRPADGRFRTGAYQGASARKKLPLPVGISDYRIASTEYYY
ncbi:MAG: hypothetical protein IJ174_09065, partial [Clostridia bacterium]|nr:hypothetical protein [Clostridia bacterium]